MSRKKKAKHTIIPEKFRAVDIWTEHPFLLKEDELYIFTNPVEDLKIWNDVPKDDGNKQDTQT